MKPRTRDEILLLLQREPRESRSKADLKTAIAREVRKSLEKKS